MHSFLNINFHVFFLMFHFVLFLDNNVRVNLKCFKCVILFYSCYLWMVVKNKKLEEYS